MRLTILQDFLNEETRLGFTIPSKMKRCWATQLKLLSMIDDICSRHGLRWFADYGTLLGAVRHNGYIPWDDDIDICMFRDDYERLFEFIPQELPQYCEAMKFGTQYNLWRGWSNVNNRENIDAGCDPEEKRITDIFYGNPYIDGIDIYPLDYVPADPDKRRDMLTRFENIMQVLRNSDDPDPALCSQAEEIARSCPRSEAIGAHCITVMSHCTPDMWRELSWYEDVIMMPFEMITVPVPIQYEPILEQRFGPGWHTPKQETGGHDYPFYDEQENHIITAIVGRAEELKADDASGALDLIRGGMRLYPERFELYFTAARILSGYNLNECYRMLKKSYVLCQEEAIREKIAVELEKFSK